MSRRGRGGGDAAQRWASIAVGIAVLFVAGWMTWEATNARPLRATGVDAAADAAAIPATAPPDAAAEVELDAGLALAPLSFGDAAAPLPSSAPRSVRIGVVLVNHQGAEGAPPGARSRQSAIAIAERLLQTARTDFHQAVGGGDPGSADDIGRIPRGVLDPKTEAAVFALPTGEISEILETPKGYWVVKRID